jgi:hypothetical protein
MLGSSGSGEDMGAEEVHVLGTLGVARTRI